MPLNLCTQNESRDISSIICPSESGRDFIVLSLDESEALCRCYSWSDVGCFAGKD